MTSTMTTALDALVVDLDAAVRRSASTQEIVGAVADALRPALGNPRLLHPQHEVGDPEGYRQHLLYVAPDGAFSVVALVWLPGQTTPIHDHLAWCVVGVHRGAEYETRYKVIDDGMLVPCGSAVAQVGTVAGLLPPGDIHRVRNAGGELAISLHVYGADIGVVGSSVRRRYDERRLAR